MRRFVASEGEAWDLVQDALLSAIQALPRYDGRARLSTWLYAIATRRGIDELRRRGRAPFLSLDALQPSFVRTGVHAEDVAAWAPGSGPEPGTPLDLAEHAEAAELVRAAVDRLAPSAQEVIRMVDLDQLERAEVAAVLEITPGALAVRLHRARLALRSLLAPHFALEPSRAPHSLPGGSA